MLSKNTAVRSRLRRKMVLPVTVFRHNAQEKQLAHTLDLTELSTRLGGLRSLLEPGEVIEIQRGAAKAKFQVFWMGATGSSMEGQAGVRSIEPGKNIWGIDSPPNQPDTANGGMLRGKLTEIGMDDRPPGEKRWHTRFECNGSASVRPEGSGFPVRGEVKDIAQGGVYVETLTPITLNTEVYIKMNVEGVPIEAAGVVRTSYPMVGMGISFQDISEDNQKRIDGIIHSIRRRTIAPRSVTEPALVASRTAADGGGSKPQANPVMLLATACRTLASDFDRWKNDQSAVDLEELRLALAQLHEKLIPRLNAIPDACLVTMA